MKDFDKNDFHAQQLRNVIQFSEFEKLDDDLKFEFLKESFAVKQLIKEAHVSFDDLKSLNAVLRRIFFENSYLIILLIKVHDIPFNELKNLDAEFITIFLDNSVQVLNLIKEAQIPLSELKKLDTAYRDKIIIKSKLVVSLIKDKKIDGSKLNTKLLEYFVILFLKNSDKTKHITSEMILKELNSNSNIEKYIKYLIVNSLANQSSDTISELLNKTPGLYDLFNENMIDIINGYFYLNQISFHVREKLIQFLSSKNSLCFPNLNRVTMVMELLTYYFFPEKLDQRFNTICGPATFLTLLLLKSPYIFIDMALNLAEQGFNQEHNFYIKASSEVTQTYTKILTALLVSIPNTDGCL